MGFFWWEIDLSYYVLRLLERLGLVWDLRVPSRAVIESNRIGAGNPDVALLALQEPSAG
jgi:stearoyl-CoA desaturase (delta-9 desaturase)